MGKYELALEDATKATELKPDWAKGYFRKGSALQALWRHEEAFQSFYECLTLEDDKSVKQVHETWGNESDHIWRYEFFKNKFSRLEVFPKTFSPKNWGLLLV